MGGSKRTCYECGRQFDIDDHDLSAEWYYNHACEGDYEYV